MSDDVDVMELREQLEKVEKFDEGWGRYLALTTALIAVVSALISLQSSTLAEQSVLVKNQAVLLQSQASDQWSYYQAKGIKKNIAEAFAVQGSPTDQKKRADQELIERYQQEQTDIQKQAQRLVEQTAAANEQSAALFERHHQVALGVTFLQIAVALSAISGLLRRKSFWYLSLALAFVGVGFSLLTLA